MHVATMNICENNGCDAYLSQRRRSIPQAASMRLSGRKGSRSGVALPKPLVQEPGWASCQHLDRQRSSHQKHKSIAKHRPGSRRRHQTTSAATHRPSYSHRRPFLTAANVNFLWLLVATLTLLCGSASALESHKAGETHGDRQADLAWIGGDLLIDTSPSPVRTPRMHLFARDSSATATLNTDPQATASASSIPEPFDTALGNNFTASCQNFFQNFLNNETFVNCHPFSLLLQTSSAFFDASKSFVRITQTLDATCNVNFNTCAKVMDDFARTIKNDSSCAVDYSNDNPMVLQAYNGLLSYQPLYQAACLRDTKGSYCYADAVTNTTAVTDSYPYYLPLGVALPAASRPTCNTCLQSTMAIFASFGGNTTQPISRTYANAAQQIDMACGPTFVNQTAAPLKAGANALGITWTPTITLLFMFIALFL